MKTLKHICGAFLLILGVLCVVSFIRLPIDTVKMGYPLSLKLFVPLALYAFIGYQSFKHGYYLLKYGESKEKVLANRAICIDTEKSNTVSNHSRANYEPESPQENMDFTSRVLCDDGACIGVIGENGTCKECGKPYKKGSPIL